VAAKKRNLKGLKTGKLVGRSALIHQISQSSFSRQFGVVLRYLDAGDQDLPG